MASAACPESEWIDSDTPSSACRTRTDYFGHELELVFSDEFNIDGRSFKDGHDPVWTALANFPSTQSQINAYDDSEEYAHTEGGKLKLKVSNIHSEQHYVGPDGHWRKETRPYTTAMIQSWNKFCFTEGVVEISAKLPGEAQQPGLWPAFWLMGNLGRATVQDSTDFMWPFAFDQCPAKDEAEANQNPQRQQAINACLGTNWTKRYGLNPHQGRGAVEIDILEAMPGSKRTDYRTDKVEPGYCSPLPEEEYLELMVQQPTLFTNLILAPGIPSESDQRPNGTDNGYPADCMPSDWSKQWYKELKPGNRMTYGPAWATTVNDRWGSVIAKDRPDGRPVRIQTDELSAVSSLPSHAFVEPHLFKMEWKAGEDGYLRFFLDNEFLYHVDAFTIRRQVNLTKKEHPMGTLFSRQLPEEPMSMLLNVDLSTIWNWDQTGCLSGECDCCTDCSDMKCWFCLVDGVNQRDWLRRLCTTLPTHYEIDYVRIYQRKADLAKNQSTSAENDGYVGGVGCSPARAPTQGWIERHRSNYYAPYSYEPLEPVYAGGAVCHGNHSFCGSLHEGGSCGSTGRCSCNFGWTGPRCLAKRAGTSRACEALEASLVGGMRCHTNGSDSTCGPHGQCVPLTSRWDRANQTLLQIDGPPREVGPGNGRCRCEEGWGDPHCGTAQTQAGLFTQVWPWRRGKAPVGGSCIPDASFRGEELEELIAAICGRPLQGSRLVRSVLEVCNQVQWKPEGSDDAGEYSRCGAWPRAALVVEAVHQDTGLCCKRLIDGELDCQEHGLSFYVLLTFVLAILSLMACFGSIAQARLRANSVRSERRRAQKGCCIDPSPKGLSRRRRDPRGPEFQSSSEEDEDEGEDDTSESHETSESRDQSMC
mmetsp:Transcript_14000/g.30953  ORF Transcript_14000/g.30953 Transcript_14000/m.30953 type:complete len:872 (+) Transcript_14000:255-2870(+)